MLFSFLVQPGLPFIGVYLFAAVVGIGTGGIIVMMYAIFPDIPDVDELKTGERREGIYSALVTLMRKMSSAVALFAVSTAIGWAGYMQPVEEIVDGASRLIDQPQSFHFILILRLIFAFVPILLVSVSILYARRYPLKPKIHESLNEVLAESRRGVLSDPDAVSQKQSLEELLI